MRLFDLYDTLTTEQRQELAKKAGIKPPYLYQIAKRWEGRRPSLSVMTKLAKADKRLTLRDLAEEFGEEADQQKARA